MKQYEATPKGREDQLRARLKYRFGVSLEEFRERLATQGGRCAICRTDRPGGPSSFRVDHDHKTGRFRGLLCHCCNTALGQVRDSIGLLSKAAGYVSDPPHAVRAVLDRFASIRPAPGDRRSYQLRYNFGITSVQFAALLEWQQNRCAVCGSNDPRYGRKASFSVDHDHETGAIRGLLCMGCNTAIGLFHDDPEVMRSAARYLTPPEDTTTGPG